MCVFFHAYSNFLSINTFMHVCIKSLSVFSLHPTFLLFFRQLSLLSLSFPLGFPFRFSIKSQGSTTKLWGWKTTTCSTISLSHNFLSIEILYILLWMVDGMCLLRWLHFYHHKEASKKVSRHCCQNLLSSQTGTFYLHNITLVGVY